MPDKTLPDRLLTVADVSAITGLAPRTIYNQRTANQGIGSLGFRLGRVIRWQPATVAAYLEDLEATERQARR